MACPNRNRHRPRTLAFRCTDEEFDIIDKRIKVTGEVKGDYLREVVLNGKVNINVGKFRSDKLALELRNIIRELQNAIQHIDEKEIIEVINRNQIMFKIIYEIILQDEFSPSE
jgi:hypothetical protein